MSREIRVLIVEDSEEDAFFIARALQGGAFAVQFERVETAVMMQAALEVGHWDVIICDYRLPEFGGPEALALYLKTGLDLPFIVVSGTVGEDLAVEMLKAGAHDYVMKDRLPRLPESVAK